MERDQKPEQGCRQTRNTIVIKIKEIKVFLVFDECYVQIAEASKKRGLVNEKGAGKVLDTNEARFRDLRRKDGGSDSENEYISLFKKMGHWLQSVNFPNSEHGTKPTGERTFSIVPAHLIIRFVIHGTNK